MRGYLRSRGVLDEAERVVGAYEPTSDDESVLDADELRLLRKLGLLGTHGPHGFTTTPWGGPRVDPARFASLFAALSAPAQQHLVDAGIAAPGGALRPLPVGRSHARPQLSSRCAAAALFTPFQFDELRDMGLALPFCAELCGRS